MKKVFRILLTLLGLFLLVKCDYTFFKRANTKGESRTVSEAIQRKSLLHEYQLLKDSGCSFPISVNDAFIERHWFYGKSYDQTVFDSTSNNYTLVIDSDGINAHFISFFLDDSLRFCSHGGRFVSASFDKSDFNIDTLKIVYKDENAKVLEEYVLIKK